LVFEVAHELDDRVLAVLGLDVFERLGAVVDEAKWRQSGNSSACGLAGAADDDGSAVVSAIGFAVGGVVIDRCQWSRGSRRSRREPRLVGR
jgi:hypothetical protein